VASVRAAAKRAFDLAGAGVALLVTAPLLIAAALAIRLDDGGPVFYRQTRIGRAGRPFRIWKLRTMHAHGGPNSAQITVAGDPRVTRAGRWLRRVHLDEVPQLLNVLVGEMSLVGPRPEVPRFVEHYTAAQRRVLGFLPGITDPASLRFQDEGRLLAELAEPEGVYVRDILPAKVALQIDYAERATIWSDLGVLARTCVVAVTAAWTAPRVVARGRRAPVVIATVIAALVAGGAGSASAQSEAGESSGPAAEATLRPGDVLRIEVWRQPELSGEFSIAPDGTVIHPLYRSLRVAGVPIPAVEDRIRELLLRYEADPQVVVEPRVRITVSGEVRQPGVHAVPIGTTLSHAVGLAGGPTERGRLDRVVVVRDGSRTTLDLADGTDGGMSLRSGDQITVMRRSDVLRDQIGPFASLAAAAAAIVSVFINR
jgi:lipopolysaccharide/colanic/teichoic acid biosynthesis glycosyltransferase/protein involved in polysaccharide export with SLBB domain